MAITRIRQALANEVVLDQADFFQGNGYDHVVGLTPLQITAKLFWNNQLQPWSLVDGSNVTDAQVGTGSIYWNEIPGAPGFYNVRFRPIGTGFWRLSLTYATGSQAVLLDYDVHSTPTTAYETGIRASFSKP